MTGASDVVLEPAAPEGAREVLAVRCDGAVHDVVLLNSVSDTHATRAAVAQATAFLRDALGTA